MTGRGEVVTWSNLGAGVGGGGGDGEGRGCALLFGQYKSVIKVCEWNVQDTLNRSIDNTYNQSWSHNQHNTKQQRRFHLNTRTLTTVGRGKRGHDTITVCCVHSNQSFDGNCPRQLPDVNTTTATKSTLLDTIWLSKKTERRTVFSHHTPNTVDWSVQSSPRRLSSGGNILPDSARWIL